MRALRYGGALLVAALVLWAGGVALSCYAAPGCLDKLAAALGAQLGARGVPLEVSYEPKERHFFSSSGALVLRNSADATLELRVPVEIRHDFLKIDGALDLYAVLNRAFLKTGVLSLQSSAYATLRHQLVTARSTLEVEFKGAYAPGYLPRNPRLRPARPLSPYLRLSLRRTFNGSLTADVEGRDLAHQQFTLGRLAAVWSAPSGGLLDERLRVSLEDLFARGTLLDDLDAAAAELTLTESTAGAAALLCELRAQTRKGRLEARADLKTFEVPRLKQAHLNLPLLLVNDHLETLGMMKAPHAQLSLQELSMAVDYAAPAGRYRYMAQAHGSLRLPATSGDLLALVTSSEGEFEERLTPAEGAGEVEAPAGKLEHFIRTADGYRLKVELRDGAVTYPLEQGR